MGKERGRKASRAARTGRLARIGSSLLAALVLGGWVATRAAALPITGVVAKPAISVAPPDPCPEPPRIQFSALPASVALGQGTVLSWSVAVQSGCRYLLSVDGRSVPLSGSLFVVPAFSRGYSLQLVGVTTTSFHSASVSVSVELPPDPADPSRKRVQLDPPSYGLLAQALRTPDTTILVGEGVDLDLSDREEIPIAAGVRLIGERSAVPGRPFRAGPRLFTRTSPRRLFIVRGDGVRISGMRIQGHLSIDPPEIASGDDDSSTGILIPLESIGTRPVEIDHCEVSGWSGAAISVSNERANAVVPVRLDSSTPALIYGSNSERVLVHDNYIHHNLHEGKMGYGVVVGGRGAHARIERNVFDWNRHAIAGDGADFSGFCAYRNLVLENGGYHMWVAFPGYWARTHQFDMHGQESYCLGFFDFDGFKDRSCGTAGYDIDIRRNSFLYTAAAAIKIRGTPLVGAVIDANVFAHGSVGDAVKWTEERVYLGEDNRGGASMTAADACDFDGDGLRDRFLATGQTWWYSSDSGRGPWVYLNLSTETLETASLGDRTGDGLCDVTVGSSIYRTGTALVQPRPTAYDWTAVPAFSIAR